MPDFNLKVTADTQEAEVKLRRVDEAAEKSTRPRSIKIDFDSLSGGVGKVANTFNNLDDKLADAANGIRKFYSIAEKVPVVGKPLAEFHELVDTTKQAAQGMGRFGEAVRENGGAGTILSSSLRVSVVAAQDLISRLSRLGLALFAVKEAAGMLQAAFGGMFAATVGREVAFRETVLKMQTTLASSQAQISVDGKAITDPYQRVLAVQGAIEKRIESIRDRALELAGVSSEQVVETFGIIVSQAGQIGVSLKQAEDLAISFAGALGTFGIPLEMARQEIQSIFTGNITSDSYLAKALNITNADIAKAKNQIGGVYGYLQEKLAAAVAGQKIASSAFAGLTSNIKEVREAVEKAFGASLLDPILKGLTTVFEFLMKVRVELAGLATSIGTTLTSLVTFNFGEIFGSMGDPTEAVRAGIIQLTNAVGTIGQAVQSAITPVLGQIRTLIDAVGASLAAILPGLLNLAKGFLSLQAANITALIGAFSTLSPLIVQITQLLSGMLAVYGQILQVPMVQYLSGIIVQWQVLGKTGIWAVMGLASLAGFLISSWSGVIKFFATLAIAIAGAFSRGAAYVATFVQSSTAMFAGLINSARALLTAFTTVFTAIATQVGVAGAALRNFGASMQVAQAHMNTSSVAANSMAKEGAAMAGSLRSVGQSAVTASAGVNSLGGQIAGGIMSFVKANLAMIALQLTIVAVIDTWSKYTQAQKAAQDNAEARSILAQYGKSLFDTSTEIDKATQRQRDFNKSIVEGEYTAAKKRLKDYENEVKQFQKDRKYADALGGWGGIEQAGLAIRAAELAKRMPGIQRDREMIKFYEDLQKAADAHAKKEADIAAAAAQTVEQIQKQVDLRKQLNELATQEAKNRLDAQLLAGDITKDQAKLKGLQNDLGYTNIGKQDKQDELNIKTSSGKYQQKDLDVIRNEIAALEGKEINIKLNINTANFEIAMKPVRYAFADAAKQLEAQAAAIQGNLTVTQARVNAETTLNNILIQGLQTDLQRATSGQERLAIAGRIRDLEINNATIALNATKQQIAASIELARIEMSKQQLAAQGLVVEIQKAAFYKQDATELVRALAVQRESVKLAQRSLDIARQVGTENGRAADATYNAAVRAANLNYATNSAAKAAGQFASNMQSGAQAATRAAGAVANTAAALANIKGTTWRAPGLEGGDILAQERLNQALRSLDERAVRERMSGEEYNAAKGQIIAWINSENKRGRENQIEAAISAKVQEARDIMKQLEEAKASGDITRTISLQSQLSSNEYSNKAFIAIAQERTEQRMQAEREARALENYSVSFSRPANIATEPGSINITTGPVYKWQDKEFVSMSDMQAAIREAKDQIFAKLRGSSGFRQELGVSY